MIFPRQTSAHKLEPVFENLDLVCEPCWGNRPANPGTFEKKFIEVGYFELFQVTWWSHSGHKKVVKCFFALKFNFRGGSRTSIFQNSENWAVLWPVACHLVTSWSQKILGQLFGSLEAILWRFRDAISKDAEILTSHTIEFVIVRARPGVNERLHSSVTIRCGRSPFFTVRGSGRPSLTLSMPQSNPHSSHLSFTLGFGINRETEPKKPISLRGSEAKDNAFCFPSPGLSCNLPVRRTRPRPRDPCHPHSDARFV